jgi:Raf kinase inhibitor-like YbhB/YbcL family protein
LEVKLALKLKSIAFKEGGRIPDKYTCHGENVSPPLSWTKADASVKSWALILEDPDASRGVFTHWVIFNIPGNDNSLPEALPTTDTVQNGALQGKNDALKTGYTGPCPPPGPVHHYNFNLYALDSMLNVSAGASKKQVQDTMKGHIISQGKLVAVYQAT